MRVIVKWMPNLPQLSLYGTTRSLMGLGSSSFDAYQNPENHMQELEPGP